MSYPPDRRTGWTQVDLIGRRWAVGLRAGAVALTLAGIVGIGLSFRAAPEWWIVGLILLACAIVILIGVSLWIHASRGERATVRLRATGRLVSLRLMAVHETTHEITSFRVDLKLPTDAEEVVQHDCHASSCIAAARAFPGSELPIMIDESRRVWGVIHAPIDR